VGDPPVVLFDGTCNFCNATVLFLVDRDRGDLRFAPLQSAYAAELLGRVAGEDAARALVAGADGSGEPDTVVFVEGGRAYERSAGALRIARHLRAPWRWAVVLSVVPGFVRDAAYRWFARRRYRWFGKTDTCRVPTPELRARFLG
jgi:predicted DCC family thiol-disulfide oxidoreductase YuxK